MFGMVNNEISHQGPDKRVTAEFINDRYTEITPEDWPLLVAKGLDPDFFDNLYSRLPGGSARRMYGIKVKENPPSVDIPMKDFGHYSSSNPDIAEYSALWLNMSEREFYAAIDDAIKEIGAGEILNGKNIYDRLRKCIVNPDADPQFFAAYIALYKKLREKGFSHRDIT